MRNRVRDRYHDWVIYMMADLSIAYVMADGNWLSGFYGFTGMSVAETEKVLVDMPDIVSGRMIPTEHALRSVSAYLDLNLAYLYKLGNMYNISPLISPIGRLYGLKIFGGNYVRFLSNLIDSFSDAIAFKHAIKFRMSPTQKKNLITHTKCCLEFAIAPVKSIYDRPESTIILRHFDDIRLGMRRGTSVGAISKEIATRTLKFDIFSIKYLTDIVSPGPIRRMITESITTSSLHRILDEVEALKVRK